MKTIIKGQKITCGYGEKRNILCSDGTRVVDVHDGLDIISTSGDKDLLSLFDGKVLFVTEDDGTGCKTIITAHGGVLPYGMVLLVKYAHCNKFYVKKGDKIKANQPIAEIGATGHATGIHCHLGCYAISPNKWHDKATDKWFVWDSVAYKTQSNYELNPMEVLK